MAIQQCMMVRIYVATPLFLFANPALLVCPYKGISINFILNTKVNRVKMFVTCSMVESELIYIPKIDNKHAYNPPPPRTRSRLTHTLQQQRQHQMIGI